MKNKKLYNADVSEYRKLVESGKLTIKTRELSDEELQKITGAGESYANGVNISNYGDNEGIFIVQKGTCTVCSGPIVTIDDAIHGITIENQCLMCGEQYY